MRHKKNIFAHNLKCNEIFTKNLNTTINNNSYNSNINIIGNSITDYSENCIHVFAPDKTKEFQIIKFSLFNYNTTKLNLFEGIIKVYSNYTGSLLINNTFSNYTGDSIVNIPSISNNNELIYMNQSLKQKIYPIVSISGLFYYRAIKIYDVNKLLITIPTYTNYNPDIIVGGDYPIRFELIDLIGVRWKLTANSVSIIESSNGRLFYNFTNIIYRFGSVNQVDVTEDFFLTNFRNIDDEDENTYTLYNVEIQNNQPTTIKTYISYSIIY